MSADANGDSELEALRRHGFGVAYRMLGSVSEAEDVAQEALLRLTRQQGPIAEPAAWITRVVTRLSINALKSARARRESYVGPWLPEPLLEDPAPGPASRAELADSLSLALLVLLERLTPLERAAYLLREAFGYEYAEIADIIERTEVNSRKLVARARKHLEAGRPRFDADEAAHDALRERASISRPVARASTPTRPPTTPCSSASSRPPRTASWRRSRSCSPRTPSCTPTAVTR
jgi:RNA polymerase sigma-70 factor, ECF subfamily